MVMIRFYKLISVILLSMAVLFCGCSDLPNIRQAGVAGTQKQETDTEATKLTFWTFVELHKQFWEDATLSWNKAHPDNLIELGMDFYPYDVMHNKLQIALQSGTGAPDLVDIELTRYPAFLKGNISLIPLNKAIEPIREGLIMGRFENYAQDGFYYGVDYHVGTTVAFYNMEIMDKAGVDPDSIKLWSDYIEAGKIVTEKTGKPMTTIEVSNMWSFYPLINQQGSDYLDKDGGIQLDNEINIKTLLFLKDMLYKDQIAILAPGGEHNKEEYYAFMNKGGAASVIMPLWYMGRFTDYMPDLKGKIAVRPMPAWEAGGFRSAGMGGTGTSITSQCMDQELAIEFLTASKLTLKGAIKCWSILGFDPVFKEVYENPALLTENKYTQYFGNELFETVKEVMNEINPVNVGEMFTEVATGVARKAIFKALMEQSQSPEQALKSLADELREKAKSR